MRKMLLVMRSEIRTTLGRKAFTILALGLPLLFALIALVFATINRDTGPTAAPARTTGQSDPCARAPHGYVDEGSLVQRLPKDLPSGWLTRYSDATAAQAALQAEAIGGYYVIPADYLQSGQVTYVRLDWDPLSDEGCSHERIEWLLLLNLFDGDAKAAAEAWHPLDVNWQQARSPEATDAGADSESWASELLPNLLALTLYVVILVPAGTLVAAVTDEKKNRVMEVLMSSVSAGQLIGGKILALGLLGLLQIVLWVGVLWGVMRFGGHPLRIPPGFSLPTELLIWTFVYGLLGYAMYGAQMAGIGALAPDIKDSRSATIIVILPLIVVNTFLMVIAQRPASPVALALSMFPLTSPVAMIARMAASEVPLWQPALAAGLELLTAILIVRLVARLFRAQTLLSGQSFTLRHLWGRS